MAKKHDYYGKSSVLEEAFITLRTNIQFSEIDRKIKTIVITSADPLEGKSSVAFRLARSFAQNKNKVLLLDCDLRNPSIGNVAEVENNVGVTNILVARTEYRSAITRTESAPDLDIILTGPTPPNPAELLGTHAMQELLDHVKEDYDYIIIDTPPVGIISDAAILSTITDGVILVMAQNSTDKADIKRAINRIEHVGGKVLGAVLNKVDISSRRGSKNYYNYY